MKNKVLVLLKLGLFLSPFIILNSCRKGQDDPWISLRSRTDRLVGEWKLMEYNLTEKNEFYDYTATSIYDGTNTTITLDNGSDTIYTYYLVLEFKKDGTFRRVETVAGSISITDGTWTFSDKNKKQDFKRKELIILNYSNYSDDDGLNSYSGLAQYQVLQLNRLSSAELKIDASYSHGYDGYIVEQEGEYIYEKQKGK